MQRDAVHIAVHGDNAIGLGIEALGFRICNVFKAIKATQRSELRAE